VVREIFEDYQSRTPGSEIEFKTINTTWHYRNADTPYAEFASQEMVTHLTLGLASRMPIEVLSGKKCIEVRPKGINKGIAVRNVLASSARDDPFDFVVCVGDDKTDEDMFAILKEPGTKVNNKFSVVVEKKPSEALSHVSGQNDVLDLLEMLAANNGVVPS
jgi:trehalose 6-phosphate synthase/phosphatase